MKSRQVRRLIAAASIVAATHLIANTAAQSYPERPVTLVLGLGAGGGVDIVARLFADTVGKNMGQHVIVENRTGGGGIPAALAVKQAPADGYTLLFVLGAVHSFAPAMQTLPFDPINDFEPVTALYSSPGYIIVSGNSPVSSLDELISYAKSKPGGLNYGSPAIGSPNHLTGALLAERTGAPMTHIPYRGGAQMMQDLLGDRLDVAFATFANFQGSLANKGVKVLAISSRQRWSGTPDVPSLAELNYADIIVENLYGIAAPRNTPKDIIDKLNAEFHKAASDPNLVRRATELGLVLKLSTPEELIAMLKQDAERLSPTIRKLGIRPE